MPRSGKDLESQTPEEAASEPEVQDSFSDADFEQWEQVSEDLGDKIEWTVGRTEVLRFTGVKTITQEDGDEVPAATFAGTSGQRYYCWLPFALKEVIDKGKVREGDVVRIACTGEQTTRRGLNPVKTFDIRVKPRTAS